MRSGSPTAVTSVVLVITTATAFAVPASHDVLVHDVLGFPSPAREVRIADVDIRESDTAYEVEITVVNKLRAEELVDEVEFRVEKPCAQAPAGPGHYRIDSEFRLGATDEKGSRLVGKAFREGDDGRFHSVVAGGMTVYRGGGGSFTVRVGVGMVLAPGQHSKIVVVVEVPRTLEVEDTRPVPQPVPSGAPTAMTPPQPRKASVAVTMPTTSLSASGTERLRWVGV